MRICKKNALRLWKMCYGEAMYAEDFHGNLMCRNGYGNPDFYIIEDGERIYCGWNLHFYRELWVAAMRSLTCFVRTLLQMRRPETGLHSGLRTVCIKFRNVIIWSIEL